MIIKKQKRAVMATKYEYGIDRVCAFLMKEFTESSQQPFGRLGNLRQREIKLLAQDD